MLRRRVEAAVACVSASVRQCVMYCYECKRTHAETTWFTWRTVHRINVEMFQGLSARAFHSHPLTHPKLSVDDFFVSSLLSTSTGIQTYRLSAHPQHPTPTIIPSLGYTIASKLVGHHLRTDGSFWVRVPRSTTNNKKTDY